ncbi:MAG: class I tRNA ligase family protein, partial [Planctomycetota bacterium]
TQDTESLSFNTAIARMMEFTNHFTREKERPIEAMEAFLILLSPYAPHIAEELWQKLGNDDTIAHAAWPSWDEDAIRESFIEVPVQVNGKVKAKIQVDPDADTKSMLEAAKSNDSIVAAIRGKTIVKEIAVPARLVNLVVK